MTRHHSWLKAGMLLGMHWLRLQKIHSCNWLDASEIQNGKSGPRPELVVQQTDSF